MRKLPIFPAMVLVLFSAAIGSQAQARAAVSQADPEVSAGCPVSFGAQVDGRAIARTAADQQQDWDAPLLQLSFDRASAPHLVGVSVVVHGLLASAGYLPVGERSQTARTQAFELNLAPGKAAVAETEVTVTKMRFVRWAELTELRYADGSTWRPSGTAECRAVPSLFRLVDLAAR